MESMESSACKPRAPTAPTAPTVPTLPTEPRGDLAHIYAAGNDDAKTLLKQGWIKIPRVRTGIDPEPLITGFDEALEKGGFSGRFGDVDTIDGPTTLPWGIWGLDPVYLPYSRAAMDARLVMRRVKADMLNLPPEQLLSSFDAVMATHSGYSTKPCFDPAHPRVPCSHKKKDPAMPAGPGHIDQKGENWSTADSYQMFLALTPAGLSDMSTCLLIPKEPYGLQDIMDEARTKFPYCFRKELKNGGDEGLFIMPCVQEHLIENDMAIAIKPDMQPGDVLIWSSAMMHCGGAGKPVRGMKRHPRLGVIAGFFPKNMLTSVALEKRRSIVGKLRATGQQVHRPNPHMKWPIQARYTKLEDWPEAYKRIKERKRQLEEDNKNFYDSEEGDSDSELVHKRKVRALLG